MGAPLGRAYLRQLRLTAGLLMAVCAVAVLAFVVEATRTGGATTVAPIGALPEGPLRWGTSFYSYNEAKVVAVAETGAGGERLLRLRLNDAEGTSYLGVGFSGPVHVPAQAELELEWRRDGYAGAIEFHVVDAGPGTPGEVFSAVRPLAGGDGWTVTRVPLSSFTRNTFQGADRPSDGVLNPDGIQSVELGFPAGARMDVVIRRLEFVWDGGVRGLPARALALPPLVLVGLVLALRSSSLDALRTPGGSVATARLANRYALALLTAAVLTMGSDADGAAVTVADVAVLAAAVAIVLLDEAWQHPLQRSRLWGWRFMALLATEILGGAVPSPLTYGLLCLAAIAPAFEHPGWPRLAGFTLLAPILAGAMRPAAPPSARLAHFAVAAGVVLLVFVVAQYLHGRQQMQLTSRTLRLYDSLFHNSPEGIYTFDAGRTITSVNPGFARLLGRPAAELVGSSLDRHLAADDVGRLAAVGADDAASRSLDLRFVDAQGAIRHTLTRIQPVAGDEGVAGFQAISTDISERRLLEEELLRANRELQLLTERDDLTNLHNRRSFDRHLRREFSRARRGRTALAIVLCDVDHFKDYNDSVGHLAGDDLLRAVAALLAEFARRAGEMAARCGGDEFALILPAVDPEHLAGITERLRAAVESAELTHPRSPVSRFLTLTIGAVSVVPPPESSPEELVAAADRALYQAKERGRNQSVVLDHVQPRAATATR